MYQDYHILLWSDDRSTNNSIASWNSPCFRRDMNQVVQNSYHTLVKKPQRRCYNNSWGYQAILVGSGHPLVRRVRGAQPLPSPSSTSLWTCSQMHAHNRSWASCGALRSCHRRRCGWSSPLTWAPGRWSHLLSIAMGGRTLELRVRTWQRNALPPLWVLQGNTAS